MKERVRERERENERRLIGLNIMLLMDRCLRPAVIRRDGGNAVYRSTSVSVKGVCFLSWGGDEGSGQKLRLVLFAKRRGGVLEIKLERISFLHAHKPQNL